MPTIPAARSLVISLCLWLWLLPGVVAQTTPVAGSVDPTLTAGTGPLGTVSAIVVQTDGKVLVAGGLKGVLRLNSDNSPDAGFNPGKPGANGIVNAVALQSTGKIIVGGSFTTYNGTACHNLIRLNTDGSVDTTFTPGAGVNGNVSALAVQPPNDQIIVGGTFSKFNTTACRNLVRLNANGAVDTTFVPAKTGGGANGSVYALAVQKADANQILVGGSFDAFVAGSAATTCGNLIRLLSDGSVDGSFQPGAGADGSVNALVYASGRILVGGSFTRFSGGAYGGILRLNGANGHVDTGFNPSGTGATGSINALAVQSDGKIIAGGSFSGFNVEAGGNNARIEGVVRFTAAGSVDTGFNNNADGTPGAVYTVAVLSNGSVFVGGSFTTFNDAPSNGLVLIAPGAAADPNVSLGAGTNGEVFAVFAQADGSLVIGGNFTSVNGVERHGIARLGVDGSLDTSFDPGTGADRDVDAVAAQADGKVILGGYFNTVNGMTRKRIARLNADGTLDTGFVPAVVGDNLASVRAVAVQTDGKVLILGNFSTINGVQHGGFARLNANGSLDTGFDPATGDGAVAMAVQTDGKIVIGGASYDDVGNGDYIEYRYFARFNADGSADEDFNASANAFEYGQIKTVAVQTDGKIVIGGYTTQTGHSYDSRNFNVARFNANGSPDTGFHLGTANTDYHYGIVSSLALQADGKIVVGGSFSDLTAAGHDSISRLNADGSRDTGFDPGAGANSSGNVDAVTVQASGKIVIGGAFTTFDEVPDKNLARVNPDGGIDTDFPPTSPVSLGIETLTVQTDQQIIFGGSFSSFGDQPRNAIARLKPDDTLDANFDLKFGSGDTVQAVALNVDNKQLYVGHRPTLPVDLDGQTKVKNPVIRCNNAGTKPTVDTTFKAGTDGTTTAIVALEDNKVLIAGQFNLVNGMAGSANLARLNADGSLDGDYNITPDGAIRGLSVVPDDQSVIIVGEFTHVNAKARNYVARTGPLGNLLAFNLPSLPDGRINAVKALKGGGALIGGNFTTVDGLTRRGVARLLSTGQVDTAFDPGSAVNGTVLSIALQSDGKTLLGGLFNQNGGAGSKNVIRLNANGSLDPTYNPGTGPDSAVKVLKVQPSGLAVLGGSFSAVNGLQRRGAARLLGDPPVITSAASATATVGKAFSYQIVATHVPTNYLVANNQPGLTLDRSTGLLTGTPTKAGTFALTLKAANASGVGTKAFTLKVVQGAPVITSTGAASGKIGKAFSYRITATNNPTSFLVGNNQPGLALDRSTGLLTGTPKGPAGTFTLTLKAANATGTGEKTLKLTITK